MTMEKMNKEDFKKALEESRVIVVGVKYSQRNKWVGYRVFVIENNELYELREISKLWDDSKGCYYCSTWGTSRPLEVILSIAKTLGLKYEEIKQNFIKIIGGRM